MVLLRTAKSCGSDAPMLASSLCEEAQMTVSNKPGHRGEREVSRKTIARGVPGDFRCDRGDYARVLCFLSHARLRAHPAPGIPCALCFEGREIHAQLGRFTPRECKGVFDECERATLPLVIVREGGRSSIPETPENHRLRPRRTGSSGQA